MFSDQSMTCTLLLHDLYRCEEKADQARFELQRVLTLAIQISRLVKFFLWSSSFGSGEKLQIRTGDIDDSVSLVIRNPGHSVKRAWISTVTFSSRSGVHHSEIRYRSRFRVQLREFRGGTSSRRSRDGHTAASGNRFAVNIIKRQKP